MMPEIGSRSGKVWGVTWLTFALNGVSAHVIEVTAGGYCSCHRHVSKWNRFVVVRGRLRVRQYPSDDRVDTTVLVDGDVCDVPPGVRHEFEAEADTTALEFYWTELREDDIVRESPGGVR